MMKFIMNPTVPLKNFRQVKTKVDKMPNIDLVGWNYSNSKNELTIEINDSLVETAIAYLSQGADNVKAVLD